MDLLEENQRTNNAWIMLLIQAELFQTPLLALSTYHPLRPRSNINRRVIPPPPAPVYKESEAEATTDLSKVTELGNASTGKLLTVGATRHGAPASPPAPRPWDAPKRHGMSPLPYFQSHASSAKNVGTC